MSLEQRNVRYLALGQAGVSQTSADMPENMNEGEIGIFDPYGNRLTNATVSQDDRFFIAVNSPNAGIIKFPEIDPSTDRVTTQSVLSSAAQEQIDYLGHNPNNSSGSIDVMNDNHYILDIYIQDFISSSSDGRRKEHADFLSSGSSTQEEIALGLAQQATNSVNHKNRPEEFMRFGAVNSAATATATADDFDNDVTVTKGSRIVSVDTNLEHNSTTITTDHYIRFAEAGSSGTVSDTDHVYKVVAVDTANNEITLDREFRYDSDTYTGTDDHQILGPNASNDVGADWGIKMEGRPLRFKAGKIQYEKFRFEYSLNNGGKTDTDRQQAAKEGHGQEEQFAELELFLQGNEGEVYRKGEPALFDPRRDIESGESYNQHDLTIVRESNPGFIEVNQSWQLIIAAPDGNPNYFDDSNTDSVTEVINVALTGSTGGPLTTS